MKRSLELLDERRSALSATCQEALVRAESACERADKLLQKYQRFKKYSQQQEPIVTVRVKEGRVDVKVFSFAKYARPESRSSKANCVV